MRDTTNTEPVDDMARDSLHVLTGLREQAQTAHDLHAYVAYEQIVREIERLRAVAAAAGRVYHNAADAGA